MTFREKTRWVALIVDLAIWAWYFSYVLAALPDGPAQESEFLWLAVQATIVTVIIHVAAIVVLAVHRPKEAEAGPDERERQIELSAGSIAHTLLAIGIVNVIIGSYAGLSKFATVNAILAVFILAELVRYVLEIIAYRRMGA
jgi:hypothetical protein